MTQRIVQVDAFTDKAFAGNPAAVCILSAPRDEKWMQQVASEMNLAETAFLLKQADGYDLRWFTPTVEVDLCGHATLASAHILWEEGHLPLAEIARFHTRSGLLTAQRRGDLIELDFPTEPHLPVTAPEIPAGLVEALGVAPRFVGKNRMDYLVEVESEAVVRGLTPNMGTLGKIKARGIIVTALADSRSEATNGGAAGVRYDFVSRFFGPATGVDEDPVTGSAHCCLGPYWAGKLNKNTFTAFQASRRGGLVQVRVEGERVKLGGHAVTTLRGELSEAASA